MMKKIAVVMMNFGGPNSLEDVESFLFNLFYDKRIIPLIKPLRWMIAKMISRLRLKKSQNIYKLMGGASPILNETNAQAEALMKNLQKMSKGEDTEASCEYKAYVCMRYCGPSARDIVAEVQQYDPDKIVLLPMYPHFSSVTTLSSLDDWERYAEAGVLHQKSIVVIDEHHMHKGFLNAHVHLLRSAIRKAEAVSKMDERRKMCVVFSAHSLPQRVIDRGDKYRDHILSSVAAIMERLQEIEGRRFFYQVAYQSKVGRMKWLEPSSESVIEKLASDGVGMIVVPISFVCENSETLVELDIDYAEIAQRAPFYIRVPTLGVNEFYISGLAEIIINLCKG